MTINNQVILQGVMNMRRSFGLWLIALFTVSIFAPLAILSVALAAYFNRMFINETESMFTNTLSSVSQHITTYAGDLSRMSMTPYFHADMMDNLLEINSGRYFTNPNSATRVNRNYHVAFSQQLATARRDVVSVLFVPYSLDNDRCFLVRRHVGSHQIVTYPDVRGSAWYKSALASDGGVFFAHSGIPDYLTEPNSHFFFTNQGQNIFSVVRLIKNPATMRPVGVIKVDAIDDVISDIFRHIVISPSSVLALLDTGGNVIYSNARVESVLLEEAANGAARVQGADGSYYVSVAPITSTPWRLCYLASEKDIRQRTAVIYHVTALFGLVCLAAALLIFYKSSRNTVQSMNQLLLAMKKIASGDLDINLDIKQKNYLATLADALNQTAKRLNSHIQSEYEAVLRQRDAEYLALQSQINPHFLNNILSSFVTLNRIGQREALEQSIVSLGRLFRYVEKNESLSTVKGELDFLEEYLTLQRLRFVDRLSFDVSCAERAEKIVIPKLLLQPLVENSIIHGMEPNGNDLRVEVQASAENMPDKPHLRIVISDDGAGFDMGGIESGSVGLSNVVKRLELFNAESVFKIESNPGAGCRCEITLPLEADSLC